MTTLPPAVADLKQLGAVGLWSRDTEQCTPDEARVLARRIEEAGYPCVWIPEGLGHEALTHASMLLHATTDLIVATGIASIWARDPFATHAGSRLLRSGHDDRFILGLGVSHRLVVGALRGHDYNRPLAAMDGYLNQLEGLDESSASCGPRVIAALGPRMLDLAAAHRTGVLTYLTTVEHTADARDRLGDSHLSAEIPVAIGSPSDARVSARRHLAGYLGLENYQASFRRLGFTDADLTDNGSDRLVDTIVTHGTIDNIRARVHERREAGADHVAIQPLDRTTLIGLLDAGVTAFDNTQ